MRRHNQLGWLTLSEKMARVHQVNTCVPKSPFHEPLQVLLDEAGIQVNVDLDQRRIANGLEAVNLASLDDKDVSCATLERLAVDRPDSTAFTDELDLVVRMPVRTWPRTRLAMEQEHRHAGVALLGSDKLMRTTNKGQVVLAYMMHLSSPPVGFDEGNLAAVTDGWESKETV